MTTTKSDNSARKSMKRAAFFAGAAAVGAMVFVAIGNTSASADTMAPGAPLASTNSGGDLNYSASFAPTSTNDLMTPMTPPPGSPWRD